jgi:ATP-binding cassette subfamily C protein CydCD
LLSSLGVALLAVTIAVRLVDGTLDLRSGLTVLILAPEVYLPTRAFGAAFHGSMEGVEAAGALLESIGDAPARNAVEPLRVEHPEITLAHVSFMHAGRTTGIADVSTVIAWGDRVVLRGPSGAGKTTLLALIVGLVHADAGTVRIGGIDVATTHPIDWRDMIAWLPQHPHLFAGTIADNLRLGRPDASEVEVRAALEWVGAGFVDDLQFGVDTLIGERGLTLSGGQRQRLALARTLLRTSPIVLLDEPLAQLDSMSRAKVGAALDERTRGRTVIIAAHESDDVAWASRSIDLGGAAQVSIRELREMVAR